MADAPPITTPGEMLEKCIKEAMHADDLDGLIETLRSLLARIAPEASPPPAAEVPIEQRGEGPTIWDEIEAAMRDKLTRPPEPDAYTLPYVEGPVPPEPAQQHGELQERIKAWLNTMSSGPGANVVHLGDARGLLRDCLAALSAPPAGAVDVEAKYGRSSVPPRGPRKGKPA